MAQITLRYSRSASGKFTDLTLQKPVSELDRLFNGIPVTRHVDSSHKIFKEIWRLDAKLSCIICERLGGLRLNLCSPSMRKMDISAILKISDHSESDNVVKMRYIDPEHSKKVETYLSFEDEVSCVAFLKCIGYLMTKTRLNEAHERQFSHICKVFDALDADSNGFLSLAELENLYPKLNIKKKDKLFEYLHLKLATESSIGMSTNEFFKFYHTLSRLPDVEFIFVTYAYSNGSINVQQFSKFLQHEQHESKKPNQVMDLFRALEVNVNAIKGCEFTLDGFMAYLFSETHNSCKNPKFTLQPHLKHNELFTNYFVKSCYIIPAGEKTAAIYKEAFDNGFRHFELDLFGSSDSKHIIVASQKQSALPIELSAILTVINECITKSTLPVILTLNLDFSKPEFYYTLANTLISLIEQKMCVFDDDDAPEPTLEELAGKILIRSSIKDAQNNEQDHDDECIRLSKLIALDHVILNPNSQFAKDLARSSEPEVERKVTEKWNTTVSFDQTVFANLSNINEGKALITTSQYFVSVSPKNSFLGTTPTLFYNFGVQSVVMPYSSFNLNSQINDAFFEHNGNCGYMMKPNDMKEAAEQADIATFEDKKDITADNASILTNFSHFPAQDMLKVSISVICGRFMPDIQCKPYVYLELYGPSPMFGCTDVVDAKRDVYRISPRWNNSFEFELPVAVYRQTVLQISLKDDQKAVSNSKDALIGSCSIHISSLRSGFRNVPLVDASGKTLSPTSVLIHTKKNRAADSFHNQTDMSNHQSNGLNEEGFNRMMSGH